MANWIKERPEGTETRTFEIIDDARENFIVGRFTRSQNEVKPEVWNLNIGQYLNIGGGRAYLRSR